MGQLRGLEDMGGVMGRSLWALGCLGGVGGGSFGSPGVSGGLLWDPKLAGGRYGPWGGRGAGVEQQAQGGCGAWSRRGGLSVGLRAVRRSSGAGRREGGPGMTPHSPSLPPSHGAQRGGAEGEAEAPGASGSPGEGQAEISSAGAEAEAAGRGSRCSSDSLRRAKGNPGGEGGTRE
ncbi:small vasohibin-binding protein isoform 1-T1 [Morphnus guianensis]